MLEAIVMRHFRHLAYPSDHDWLIAQIGHQALEGRVGQHNLQEASPLHICEQQLGASAILCNWAAESAHPDVLHRESFPCGTALRAKSTLTQHNKLTSEAMCACLVFFNLHAQPR